MKKISEYIKNRIPKRDILWKTLLESFNRMWDILRTTVTALVALVVFLAALAALIPDQREIITEKVYETTGLTEKAFTVDSLSVSGIHLQPGRAFSFCPGGFFVDLWDKPAPNQLFARLAYNHVVQMGIRKNPLTHQTVTIKEVYVNVVDAEPMKRHELFAHNECGAGGVFKEFYIDEDDYSWSEDQVIPSRIKAKIDPENEVKFDYIVLNDDEDTDYIRVYIPAPKNSVVGLNVEFVYEVEGEENMVQTERMYLGRSDWVEKYYPNYQFNSGE